MFIAAVLLAATYLGEKYWQLTLALVIAGFTGYLDDRKSLPVTLRLILYSVTAGLLTLLILPSSALSLTVALHFILVFIFMLGVMNTFNFMDGINGITTLYALVTIGSLYFFPLNFLHWSIPMGDFLFTALVIFAFFNVRKRAIAFMGDSGSILIGAFCAFLVLGAAYRTEDIGYLLLLSVYGVDSLGTIILRLLNRENITAAHRSHAYQLLCNEGGWGHVTVSLIYAVLQIAINLVWYFWVIAHYPRLPLILIVLLLLIVLYFAVKFRYHRESLLLWKRSNLR